MTTQKRISFARYNGGNVIGMRRGTFAIRGRHPIADGGPAEGGKCETLRKLEIETARLNEENEKLRQTNEFLLKIMRATSHDIGGAMNGIMGLLDIMRTEADLQDNRIFAGTCHERAEKIHELLSMLSRMRKTAEGQDGQKMEPISAYDVADAMISAKQHQADGKGITLFNNVPKMLMVIGNNDMLSVALQNLISNAIKFTKVGGKIIVSAAAKEGKVVVTVEDNGVGMMECTCQKLFEGEMTSSPGTDGEAGTGQGLILVKYFVELQGGEITVESQLGKGSKFHISLKAAQQA